MRPATTQRPHPPLYIAANSEDSVLSAARLGLPALSSFFVPVSELQRRHAVYRETALAAGRTDPEIAAPSASTCWRVPSVGAACA